MAIVDEPPQLNLMSPPESIDVRFSLACKSFGGPVINMTWTRDGSPLKNTGPLVLKNASIASYTNVLEVNSRAPGTYTCQIRRSSGQIVISMAFTVQGITVRTVNNY